MIVPKSNGKWCIYSNNVERIIADDLSDDDVIRFMVEEAIMSTMVSINRELLTLLEGRRRPAITYDEAVKRDERTRKRDERND